LRRWRLFPKRLVCTFQLILLLQVLEIELKILIYNHREHKENAHKVLKEDNFVFSGKFLGVLKICKFHLLHMFIRFNPFGVVNLVPCLPRIASGVINIGPFQGPIDKTY
jgi:hypothetical protein